jgi:hypothetical protein
MTLHPGGTVKDGFYLEIPIRYIRTNSLPSSHVKYLRFIAWSIIALEGIITLESKPVADPHELINQGTYVFDATADMGSIRGKSASRSSFILYRASAHDLIGWLSHVVDERVLGQRSGCGSSTEYREQAFKKSLLDRDRYCVLTGKRRRFTKAAHIIPFAGSTEVRWVSMLARYI